MKRYFLYIVLFLSVAKAFSQTGCFTVDNPRGCAPLTIHITNCYTGGGTAPTYDYGNGKFIPTTDTTLSVPGIYTITQRIFQSGTIIATETVEVLPSPTPKFKIEFCQGNVINLVIQDSQYDKYIIDYGDGSPSITVDPLTTNSHSYSSSVSRTVFVKGAYLPLMCGATATLPITPLAGLIAPDLQKLQVNNQGTNGQITLSYLAQPSQKYIVQQRLSGSGIYTTVDTLKNKTGLNQYTITTGINTQSNQYGYTLTAIDDCGNKASSAEIFSIINNVTPGNNQNTINWNGIPTSLTNYQVIKNQNSTSPITTINSTSYIDTPIQCGEVNCYYISANMSVLNSSGSPLVSISDSVCAKGISTITPTAIQNFNSTYVGNNILLTWNTPTAGVQNYTLRRSEDGAGLTTLKTFTETSYTDNSLNPNSTYCYQISYLDDCGNSSPVTTNGTCAIKLTVEINPDNIFENLLSWTPYTGAGNSISYTIEKLNEAGQVISSTPSATLTTTDLISDQTVQVVRYRIKAMDDNGFSSYSEVIEITYEGAIKFPTAFTPNGDGVNDKFISINKFIKEYQLTIYNRWGEVVFNSTNPKEGWDGMYKGVTGTTDTYSYLVEVIDLWDKKITKRGTVTLLK